MATPQRNFPDEPRPELRPVDPATPRAERTGGGRSLFWIWIVLFIAAIVWFSGWGWGGYGGWWWGRSPAVTGPAYTSGTVRATPATGAKGKTNPQQPGSPAK